MTDFLSLVSREITRVKATLGNLAVDSSLASGTPNAYVPGFDQSYSYSFSQQKIVPVTSDAGDYPGTQIAMQDVSVLLLDPSASAKTNDFMQFNGKDYRIVAVNGYNAGTKIVLQKLLLRPEVSGILWGSGA